MNACLLYARQNSTKNLQKVQNSKSKAPQVNNFIYTVTAELILHALVQFMVCVYLMPWRIFIYLFIGFYEKIKIAFVVGVVKFCSWCCKVACSFKACPEAIRKKCGHCLPVTDLLTCSNSLPSSGSKVELHWQDTGKRHLTLLHISVQNTKLWKSSDSWKKLRKWAEFKFILRKGFNHGLITPIIMHFM